MAEQLSCLRRHRRPGNITEVRRPRLYKGKRFNLEIISSRIESLIYGSSRRTTRLDRAVTGRICRENKYDEFRG
jgi:hypothetical protein